MKKLLVVIAFLCSITAQGQFRYANQWAVAGAVGITQNAGVNVQIGADHIFGLSVHGIQMRGSFMNIPVNTEHGRFDYQRYAISVNYAVSLDGIIQSPWFFLQLTAGGVFGYDNTPKYVAQDVELLMRSTLVGGLNVAPQFEFKVAKSIHLYAEPRFTYLFKSAVDNYDWSMNAGIKIYL